MRLENRDRGVPGRNTINVPIAGTRRGGLRSISAKSVVESSLPVTRSDSLDWLDEIVLSCCASARSSSQRASSNCGISSYKSVDAMKLSRFCSVWRTTENRARPGDEEIRPGVLNVVWANKADRRNIGCIRIILGLIAQIMTAEEHSGLFLTSAGRLGRIRAHRLHYYHHLLGLGELSPEQKI